MCERECVCVCVRESECVYERVCVCVCVLNYETMLTSLFCVELSKSRPSQTV